MDGRSRGHCDMGLFDHSLEIVLAILAPTSLKTSKRGGLDWVRFNQPIKK
jgi:hypothetical protein